MEPRYKQHAAVDDQAGVIVDVAVTTGEVSEGSQLPVQIERIESNTTKKIKTLTADAGYAFARNYAHLESRGIEAIIPPPARIRRAKVPLCRFKYDRLHNIVRCPQGRVLQHSYSNKQGAFYRAKKSDCTNCPLFEQCVPGNATTRAVLIVDGYESLLRTRRWKDNWCNSTRRMYQRHRWRAEGIHGEAKTQHGLRRATRRGLVNVEIQSYMTAATMNLKRLARRACALIFANEWLVFDTIKLKIISIEYGATYERWSELKPSAKRRAA